MKKGAPYLKNRTMYPACWALRIIMTIGLSAYLFRWLIVYPILAMRKAELPFGDVEWAMVITGVICTQILLLSVYREIKYGGYR